MSVIARVGLDQDAFELGRILTVSDGVRLELGRVVPLGESIVPLVWVHGADRDGFESAIEDHPSIDRFEIQEAHEDRTLVAIEWQPRNDQIIDCISESGGYLVSATGTESGWQFELRFPDHAALGAFKDICSEADIDFQVVRISNPGERTPEAAYGLTGPQREALELAHDEGYFDIPRKASTKALGDTLGISDQAVTERLRRGISRLVDSTLKKGSSGR